MFALKDGFGAIGVEKSTVNPAVFARLESLIFAVVSLAKHIYCKYFKFLVVESFEIVVGHNISLLVFLMRDGCVLGAGCFNWMSLVVDFLIGP